MCTLPLPAPGSPITLVRLILQQRMKRTTKGFCGRRMDEAGLRSHPTGRIVQKLKEEECGIPDAGVLSK